MPAESRLCLDPLNLIQFTLAEGARFLSWFFPVSWKEFFYFQVSGGVRARTKDRYARSARVPDERSGDNGSGTEERRKMGQVKVKKGWQLKDIIMIGILGLIFAAIYLGAFYLSQAIGVALTPFGLAPFNFEIVYGVWFMAATLAAFILQKPGVALVTEVLAAFLELLMGNFPLVITTGLVQGVGLELGFAVFGYKK